MKTLIALCLSLGALVMPAQSVRAETPIAPYSVKEDLGNSIEIREYPTALVAETELLKGDKNSAFKILADYIFGKNSVNTNIGMTAPVDMGGENIGMTAPVDDFEVDGKSYMRFYMPTHYTLETLPKPLDARVILREEPASHRIVIRFSGTMNEANVSKHQAILNHVMHEKNIVALSAPILSGYDAPWTPWFLRRNEISYRIK